MSRFTGHLGLCTLEFSTGLPASRGGLALFWLPEPLPYEVGALGSECWHVVPAFDRPAYSDADLRAIGSGEIAPRGVTDLGSIPPLGRWLVPTSDPALKAFVTHDDGYATRGGCWSGFLGRPATRGEIDAEIKVAMKALGAPGWKREIVYRAVDLGGGSGWGK